VALRGGHRGWSPRFLHKQRADTVAAKTTAEATRRIKEALPGIISGREGPHGAPAPGGASPAGPVPEAPKGGPPHLQPEPLKGILGEDRPVRQIRDEVLQHQAKPEKEGEGDAN
jgi:hypothetical protein